MENLRGSALMVLAMFAFALEDMFIKRLSVDLPLGQIVMLVGIGGTVIFGTAALSRRQRLVSRDLVHPSVLLRNLGDVVATVCFVTALALTPISSASAILQAVPLAVTLGAALFLKEPVGWRRWLAIIVGFLGVLMIVRPGLDGFEPASLFAVGAVAGLALRDLATRRVPASVGSFQLGAYAFFLMILTGLAMLAFEGPFAPMSGPNWRDIALAQVFGVLAYWAIIAAMRVGEVSFIAPFRYTRLVFAMVIGLFVFGERPDALMLAGSALIIASGLYTFFREQRLRRRIRAGL